MISQTSTSLIRATAKQSRNVTARRLNTNNATTTRESFAFYPANTRTVPKDIAASVKNGNQSFSFYPANGVSQRIPRSQASAAPKQVREQVVQQQQQQQTSSYSKTELDALFAQSRAVAQKRPQQKVTESSINESFAFYPTKQGVVANTSTKSSDSFAFYGSNGVTRKRVTNSQIQNTAAQTESQGASESNNNNKVAVALGSIFMGALVQGRRSLARA
eukprot:CAMPEP_0117018888 /NCGR_PEP_ID=MMETSP0472-20121206/14556_1 /TAXON_ID=693140 ORGANISM="Tiarina fusus, Strain LIS" /NCGR_SAMPLE_ID=MMETSP0472 /ASSEMBLY_ACC=CAM_ASM_000603 /LENGTH=217 /DNA_ID=CAMNT_0004723683 /DNA_START=75 /DNA_END=728 /DNA_ORIENTATION=-